MRVHIPKRKSQTQRILESVTDTLAVPNAVKQSLPRVGADSARKAGLIAGALAGLTAGSASISVAQATQRGGEGRFVKLTKLTIFAAGYIIGTRAGRERYAQILEGAAKASQRLEEFSARRSPRAEERDGPDAGGARSSPAPEQRSSHPGFGARPRSRRPAPDG